MCLEAISDIIDLLRRLRMVERYETQDRVMRARRRRRRTSTKKIAVYVSSVQSEKQIMKLARTYTRPINNHSLLNTRAENKRKQTIRQLQQHVKTDHVFEYDLY